VTVPPVQGRVVAEEDALTLIWGATVTVTKAVSLQPEVVPMTWKVVVALTFAVTGLPDVETNPAPDHV
jgi:hypothetical protein